MGKSLDGSSSLSGTSFEQWSGRGHPAVVFECVGRPGMVNAVILQVPRNARVVVVGNVLGESSIDQVVAFNKELDLRFAMNYTSAEFGKTLNDIADGRIERQGP